MSTKEQEKIIQALRSKAVKMHIGSALKDVKDDARSLDKRAVREKAKKAGKTISDDSLLTPHFSGT